MQTQYFILILVLVGGAVASILARKLTVTAAITGALTGLLVFLGNGWTGIIMMSAFFVLGTVATSWRKQVKEDIAVSGKDQGRRTAGQVLANAGFAGICGFLAWCHPYQSHLFALMTAATFSSATADTLSSELGIVYGKKSWNILSLKEDKRGRDGVVSLEGTLFGLAGSVVIAIIFISGEGWNIDFFWIILAGTIGNLADSIIGATLERKGIIGNNAVNFLNTCIAGLVVLLLLDL